MSLRAAVFAGLQILFAFSLKVLKTNDKPETMVPLAHWTTAVRREDVAQSNCNTELLCRIHTPTVYCTVCTHIMVSYGVSWKLLWQKVCWSLKKVKFRWIQTHSAWTTRFCLHCHSFKLSFSLCNEWTYIM